MPVGLHLGKEKGNDGVLFWVISMSEHHGLLNCYNKLYEAMVDRYIFI
jgi:hypothetical protein